MSIASVSGCGSPEQYQKQGVEADTNTVEVALGMEVGDEHAPWAREFILEMGQSRLRYDEGDTIRAFFIADSLIDAATRTLDTVPFHDPRAKFVLLMLTDLYSQTITWQELKGDAADVRRRTARFQDLATRVRYLRDSVDRSQ
jgi:hypothetical protein